jgi:hypothetical protein
MRWDEGANFRRSLIAGDKGICAQANDPGGYKMVLMSAQGGMNNMYLNATQSGWSVYDQALQMKESTDSAGTGRNNDGVWHHFEYYFQYETGVGSNGILRAWRDGVKIHERTNINFKTGGGSKYISFQMIQYTGSSCDSSGYQIDDIEVWDDMPTETKSIIPPDTNDSNPNPPGNLIIR